MLNTKMGKMMVLLGSMILSACHLEKPEIKLIATHPMDNTLFIQGLEQRSDGKLIYSSGLYGQSEIGIWNLEAAKKEQSEKLPFQIFAEGLTQTPYGIWQLSWREQTAFLWDAQSLRLKRSAFYASEGWGLAYDAKNDVLWLSDGSAVLQKMHPQTFAKLGEVQVDEQGQAVDLINELEFVDGFLYANVWQSNNIIKINPENGKVVKKYDFSSLVQPLNLKNRDAVLNGIAYMGNQRFLITGKLFPVAWEVKLN